MRITKKSSSNIHNMIQVISHMNQNQKKLSSLHSQFESGNKNQKNQKSFVSEKESFIKGEPIKVQLVKNNQNKRIYSTKTIDYKTSYKTGNNNMNFEKKSSNDVQKQDYKIPTESNEDNNNNNNNNNNINSYFDKINKYSDLGNIDQLKKYLIPKNNQQRNSTKMNKPKVISMSPLGSQYIEEEENKNLRQNRLQNGHKMRDLLSQKFTYNKPKTTSTPNNIKKRTRVYDIKTYCNNNIRNSNIDNISVNSFNINRVEKKNFKDNLSAISFDESPYMINHINNNNNFMPEIKLDDLIIFDERLNDISVALNNRNYDFDASNECAEFFVFFFHSSLQKVFPTFFNQNNKIIIESANNLTLFAIIITYHLSSLMKDLLREVINMVNNILSLLKFNLYLNVKKIQIFYGDEFVERNKFYFKTFNYYLKINSLLNAKEEDIILKIDHNCRLITNDIKKILRIYQQINNPFYKDFLAIFNNISILSEKDLKDYFYAKLYNFNSNSKSTDNKKKRKINITKGGKNNNRIDNKGNGNYEDYNDDKNNLDNADVISVKSSKSSHYYGKIDKHNFKILQLLNDYEKNKIEPPFITIPNKKKYSLVLDLDETLINLEIKDKTNNKCILHFRPGLFSFLSDIKPFCELITFTSASKEYARPIINEIELKTKYFDYCLFREHSAICGNDFVKDISRIGRDMKKIIIIDNMEENFRLNKKNGIKIYPFYGDENDNVLNELKKILIMIFKQGYEDLTLALENYSYEIKKKVTMES